MCAKPHFNLCTVSEVKLDNKNWYEHVQKSVETSCEGNVTTLWNKQVQTDRAIPNNKPDIIIRDNKKRNMYVNRLCNFWRQKCD